MTGRFLGGKRIELRHDDSGVTLVTDAPKDNNGDGSSFSPTDLFAVSLASCVLTTMAIVAERDGVDLGGSYFTAQKEMASNPRRIGRIVVTLHLPRALPVVQREKLERAGHTCPVHKSVHPDVQAPIEFLYDVG